MTVLMKQDANTHFMRHAARFQTKHIKIIQIVFAIAIIFFIGKYLSQNYVAIADFSFAMRPLHLAISSLLFLSAFFFMAIAWRALITIQGTWKITIFDALWIWMISFMGRYVPGKVTLVAVRIILSRKLGIPSIAVTANVALEMLLFLFISLLFSFPIVFHPLFFHFQIPILSVLACGIFSAITVSAFRKRILSRLALAGLARDRITLSLARAIAWYGLHWVFSGLSVCIFVSALITVTPDQYVFLISAYALSFTLGILAVFTPSGLGVREAVFAIFLSTLVPLENAVLLAVIVRIWTTVCEIFFVSCLFLGKLLRSGK